MRVTAASLQRNDWLVDKDGNEFPKELEGGRNLLRDSKELKAIGGTAPGLSRYINRDGHLEIVAEEGNGNYVSDMGIELQPNHNLRVGDIITFSIQVKSDDADKRPPRLYLGSDMSYKQLEGKVSSEFSTIYYSREYKEGERLWIPHLGFSRLQGTYVFKNAKVEKSSNLTPWTPAPEDLGLSYPDHIQEFIPTGHKNSTLVAAREFIEYPEALEGERNLVLGSDKEFNFADMGDIATSVQDFEGRNIIENSSFHHGLDRWGFYANQAELIDGRAYFKRTDAGEKGVVSIHRRDLDPILDNLYYVSVDVENVKDERIGGVFINNGGRPQIILNMNDGNGTASNIYQPSSWSYLYVNSRVGDEFYLGNFNIVNLTQGFGEGNEPSKEWCDENLTWQPAPEDLTHAKQYTSAKPLQANQDYTLSIDTDIQNDWLGVWIGRDYFAGYLEDGKLTFKLSEEINADEIIIKSLNGKGTVSKIALKIAGGLNDWTPAPEDLGLDYPEYIQEFKPCVTENYVMGREIISYPQELEGGRNLLYYTGGQHLKMTTYAQDIREVDGKMAVVFGGGDVKRNMIYLQGTESSLVGGKTYTFSFYAKATSNLNLGRVYLNPSNTNYMRGQTISTKWERYSFSFKANDREDNRLRVHMYPTMVREGKDSEEFYITEWKLEEGENVTPWTLAPEVLNLHYPDWITEFKPSINKNGILMREYKEGSQYIEGSRNLFPFSSLNSVAENVTERSFSATAWASTVLSNDWLTETLSPSTTYTLNYEVELLDKPNLLLYRQAYARFYIYKASSPSVVMGELSRSQYEEMIIGDRIKVNQTFTTPDNLTGYRVLLYTARHSENGVVELAEMLFSNIKLEKGSTPTQWTPAPEDYGLEEW